VRPTQEVDNANDNTADHEAALKKARAGKAKAILLLSMPS